MIVAGAGFMGRAHLRAAKGLPGVSYVGVVDSRREAAEESASAYGLPAFTELAPAIALLRPDAVDVCVPTPSHLPLVEACAERGVHVLCEKPVALSLPDARRVCRLADEKKIRVMIAQVLRFWPEYRFAVEAARGKQFGSVLSVDCRRLSPPPDWNSWMMQEDVGGGAAIDLQIHDMDFILQLLGPPRAVEASGRREQGAWNAVRSRLVFDSPAQATVHASYLEPSSYPFRMFFHIEFEEAALEMDFWRPKGERLRVFPRQGQAFSPALPAEDAYAAEIAYFARSLAAGAPFDRAPLGESVVALQMCLASRLACEEGRAVELAALEKGGA